MINNCCKRCDCRCRGKKYIVLQDFWLRDIKLMKGEIIGEPVSPRWITLRLVAPYKPETQNAKKEAQRIANEMHIDKAAPEENETETSEITVPERTEEEKQKRRRSRSTSGRSSRRRKKDTVIVETPEKSEILLEKMIKTEADSL